MKPLYSIADTTYGSTFFMATGFHVIIGTTFLIMILIRHNLKHWSPIHHFGIEAVTWYWHFVDVDWLYLFTSIYWWGGGCLYCYIKYY